MKPNINLYASMLTVLLLFWACDKGPELTPITQEGKNTFSCKVNGKVWIPDGRGSIFVIIPPIDGGFFKNSFTDSIEIWIQANADNGEEMHIFLSSLDLGKRTLDAKTHPVGESFTPANYGLFRDSKRTQFITSESSKGMVLLEIADTTSGIIAGTFEFTASDPKGNLVKITEGRFDINSKTL
ncbi:DUF6252 family protein [Dyadobacter sp. LHD-138]|uniref:DUF6252 family protein n=1 Tax=Dyadobacter sp. LHD-138 TaxID=3071413 RepID=UPI0027E1E09E|nr:DUF6252 family protein [Dyadobacter sp. LHD-138]MDQ6482153.1 DUF6252 family protein [Dyadobacter sp. LHD-138]